MRDAGPNFPAGFALIAAVLIGLSLGQVAPAGSDEPADTQTDSSGATDEEATARTGPQVYNAVCVACHAPPGLGGAPALGDSEAWAERIDQGVDTLIRHTLNGYSGSAGIMPRRGGRPDLTDAEVVAAVEFMVERASP